VAEALSEGSFFAEITPTFQIEPHRGWPFEIGKHERYGHFFLSI
jgi:hypothetical protein